ncbi:winged helix-turn-helix domain-containing protein [Streptomyces sp. IB201691-2A2]|jgi:ArsR family transcriptional regulator|uniref:ArsR/SmtB family transcription factor n=1 Tax=Streptomyces sp. IB201691-2A2 TaxID=2561920 RepID=UPI00117E812B|nr:winged helix-turn-helix domain-containing protein [Streptomyces sp. IB201691-2A2]TRO69657.1 ArsR family transcriptional regulator [Streptomyces sp. IB201691-2A2]
MPEVPPPEPTGDELLKVLSALGNPHRLRIVAALMERRNYVSALAREIGMGRPLLHMHLQRLEAAGLVVGTLELSEDGKAMKYFEVAPFCYRLTPHVIARAATTITEPTDKTNKADQPAQTTQSAKTAKTAKEEAK